MGIFKIKILPKGIVKEIMVSSRRLKVRELIRLLGYSLEDVVVIKGDGKILTDIDEISENDNIIVFTVFSGG